MVMVDITILNLEYLQSISSFEIHSWFHMVSLFLTLKFGVIYIYIYIYSLSHKIVEIVVLWQNCGNLVNKCDISFPLGHGPIP